MKPLRERKDKIVDVLGNVPTEVFYPEDVRQCVELLKKELAILFLNHRRFGKYFGLGDDDQVFIHWTDKFDEEFKKKIDEWVGV